MLEDVAMVINKWTFARFVRFTALVFACLVTYTLSDLLIDVIHLQFNGHVTSRTCRPLLCLFTTFKPGHHKVPVSIINDFMAYTYTGWPKK